MRLLLDSHYCFWIGLRREKLSKSEMTIISDPDNDLAFPSVAIWELRIKWDRRFVSGERKGEASAADVLVYLQKLKVPAIDLTPELAAMPLQMPLQHTDPFDTLLLTIAQETGRRLFTRDEKLRGHPMAFHAD